MGTVENKDVVRRMVDECVNTHRADLLDRFVAADVRVHPGTPGTAPDTEGLQQLRESFHRIRTGLPDLHVHLDDVMAEGDRVAARWTGSGTHSGELAGLPPTGTVVRWGGTDIYRIDGGKVAEWWRNDDMVGLLHQLGRDLTPSPG
ncbi:ester cyclase [Blastococcus saxobsidens]|uniref:Putative ester cyclase n=1 Tax=Blastococcus saxobsidens TaxID=138336 RepID=A0A4Q7Y307_9ACTN|nr:ester cyclase [Blastococcus saxobsidens]RZU31227.1 putative ester cyclase [Blastococcus saxobsidens]